MKEYVNQNSLQKHVHFQGETGKVSEILSICDIGVFPSEFEGMSIALLEMMAAGLPIVCSDIPNFKTIFIESESVIFFPVKDHITLADKLGELCNSSELQDILGRKAKLIAQKYSLEVMIQKHEIYYD